MDVSGVTFETRHSSLRSRDSEVSGVIGIATDITERKEAEEALQESEQRYRAVIEQALEGIFLVDIDSGRILESNSGNYILRSPNPLIS